MNLAVKEYQQQLFDLFDFQKTNLIQRNKDIVNWLNIKDEMQTIDAWNNKAHRSNFNFVELFAGAGGMSCGLAMSGFNPVSSIEIMPEAVQTYQNNFKKKGFETFIETKDIRKESTKQELYEKVQNKHIHLISGGFPCQGFSIAGNRIVDDERNSLYTQSPFKMTISFSLIVTPISTTLLNFCFITAKNFSIGFKSGENNVVEK